MCASNGLFLNDHGFLGRGSRGRVFIVCSKEDGTKRALKVVLTEESATELQREYDTIKAYTHKYTGLPVVSICANNDKLLCVDKVYGANTNGVPPLMAAGYLMSTVGVPAPWETLEGKQDIFKSLCQFHKQKLIHGDPRRQNVILSDKKLLWIDFMTSNPIVSVIPIKQDVKNLLRSLYSLPSFPQELQELLETYASSPDESYVLSMLQQLEGQTL
jgi:tRNA A-37 threonylcarbamoyl transferase component Bud32